MLTTRRPYQRPYQRSGSTAPVTAPLRRPGAVGAEAADRSTVANGPARHRREARRADRLAASAVSKSAPLHSRTTGADDASHALVKTSENQRLYAYESGVKNAFDEIVPVLKRISALQGEADFENRAQQLARQSFGFELPANILADAWVSGLDMRRLFAWCVFETNRRFADEFFAKDPLNGLGTEEFAAFLQSCGFHIMDISPCADGRLAHLIRYVLRLPYRAVRRKSYAGAMFDIENSVQKWVETELQRFREGKPNFASDPTRYLKVVAYHFSSVDTAHEGCAAHGSDTEKAAAAGLERLLEFRQAIENSFCCGASIDLLLIGVDTDTDSLRIHVPDADGNSDLGRYVSSLELFDGTRGQSETQARESIRAAIRQVSPGVSEGSLELIAMLIENNFSQIAYVRRFHGPHYQDIGHAERFIGAGIGFEEIQLRNLMYFAYLNTVEEAAPDLDVGIKIFTGLNVAHGLPVPVLVRFDYHGQVPGARDRAVERCERVAAALLERYSDLFEKGLLHVMQVVRDCHANGALEVLTCTANPKSEAGAH